MCVIKEIKYFDFFIEMSNIDTSTRLPVVYTCYKYCISLNSDINIVHFTYCHWHRLHSGSSYHLILLNYRLKKEEEKKEVSQRVIMKMKVCIYTSILIYNFQKSQLMYNQQISLIGVHL